MKPRCPKKGKVKHASRSAAEAHARDLAKRGKGLTFAYICPHCNSWHVGHNDPLRPVGKLRK